MAKAQRQKPQISVPSECLAFETRNNIVDIIINPSDINMVDNKALQNFLILPVGISKISNAPLTRNGS